MSISISLSMRAASRSLLPSISMKRSNALLEARAHRASVVETERYRDSLEAGAVVVLEHVGQQRRDRMVPEIARDIGHADPIVLVALALVERRLLREAIGNPDHRALELIGCGIRQHQAAERLKHRPARLEPGLDSSPASSPTIASSSSAIAATGSRDRASTSASTDTSSHAS